MDVYNADVRELQSLETGVYVQLFQLLPVTPYTTPQHVVINYLCCAIAARGPRKPCFSLSTRKATVQRCSNIPEATLKVSCMSTMKYKSSFYDK